MPDSARTPPVRRITPIKLHSLSGPGADEAPDGTAPPTTGSGGMVCDRCGGQMYRMHAVWRCSACGFKTDCCGW
jgi:hypothetical protein